MLLTFEASKNIFRFDSTKFCSEPTGYSSFKICYFMQLKLKSELCIFCRFDL